MLIVAKKLHPVRLLAVVAFLTLATGFTIGGFGLARDIQKAEAVANMEVSPKNIKTNADRISYFECYGWLVGAEPVAVEEVLIPKQFDSSYKDYLALQESQGFHLEDYAGKTVKRYTYSITNYPGLKEGIWGSLLIYKKNVIGGEIYSCEGDGFTASLSYPIEAK